MSDMIKLDNGDAVSEVRTKLRIDIGHPIKELCNRILGGKGIKPIAVNDGLIKRVFDSGSDGGRRYWVDDFKCIDLGTSQKFTVSITTKLHPSIESNHACLFNDILNVTRVSVSCSVAMHPEIPSLTDDERDMLKDTFFALYNRILPVHKKMIKDIEDRKSKEEAALSRVRELEGLAKEKIKRKEDKAKREAFVAKFYDGVL